jgi:hypothetical protein
MAMLAMAVVPDQTEALQEMIAVTRRIGRVRSSTAALWRTLKQRAYVGQVNMSGAVWAAYTGQTSFGGGQATTVLRISWCSSVTMCRLSGISLAGNHNKKQTDHGHRTRIRSEPCTAGLKQSCWRPLELSHGYGSDAWQHRSQLPGGTYCALGGVLMRERRRVREYSIGLKGG